MNGFTQLSVKLEKLNTVTLGTTKSNFNLSHLYQTIGIEISNYREQHR